MFRDLLLANIITSLITPFKQICTFMYDSFHENSTTPGLTDIFEHGFENYTLVSCALCVVLLCFTVQTANAVSF